MRILAFAFCFSSVSYTFSLFDVSYKDFCMNTFSQNYNISWFSYTFSHFLLNSLIYHRNYEYCDWASWSSWTTCSSTCRMGYQQRERKVCFYNQRKELTDCVSSKESMAHLKKACKNSCLEDINDCSSTQCKNGGICHNNWDSFTCTCQSRYNGSRCESDYGKCDSKPCLNNGTCINIRNGFHCACTTWFTGRQCEIAKVVNCPDGIQEVNFTKVKENITRTSFVFLPEIYGQSCDGRNITILFPIKEYVWSAEIGELVLTVNDTRGQSLPCIVQFRTNDFIQPTFVNCPSDGIKKYGSNGGSIIFWTPIVAEDNSGNVTVTSNKASGEFMPFGTHVVQYNATDPSGNTDICQFTVKVNEMPRAQCESPPQVLHGIVSCQDRETLTCGIDYCYSGYIQTNNQSYTCQKGEWTPKFSSEFQTSSCFKPEPTKLDRNYTFSFTCPKLKFSPLDLRDCIRQSGLCPSGDILLCDKPFQRIEGKHLSAEDLQIWTTLEGILPYQANKNELITRMDVHGISIANYFTNGTFKDVCHQLKCQFEKIKADPIREICGIGTVEYLMEGRKTCRKCGPGWYYDNGDCVQCSEGFYQDQFGQQTCEKCPEGTTSVIGTLIKSECYIEVIVEKQASSSSFNTLALIGIAISGLLLLVFVILVVLVNKWRMSANKKNSDDNTRRNQDSHTGCSEPQSEVYDEIKDDAVLEGYVIYKPGDTISCGVYETLPGRERVENPYTRISWRNY